MSKQLDEAWINELCQQIRGLTRVILRAALPDEIAKTTADRIVVEVRRVLLSTTWT